MTQSCRSVISPSSPGLTSKFPWSLRTHSDGGSVKALHALFLSSPPSRSHKGGALCFLRAPFALCNHTLPSSELLSLTVRANRSSWHHSSLTKAINVTAEPIQKAPFTAPKPSLIMLHLSFLFVLSTKAPKRRHFHGPSLLIHSCESDVLRRNFDL